MSNMLEGITPIGMNTIKNAQRFGLEMEQPLTYTDDHATDKLRYRGTDKK